ncbi:MAG: hypothetical protein ACSHW0_08620 [Thalassotalea sp.]
MQTETSIPEYLADDFSMYLENMTSLADPENPELLSSYLANLFEQLKQMPLLFTGMVDQLAMAISTKIRIDSKSLSTLALTAEPTWLEIKPFVGVHADARTCITEIMENSEQDLKTAVLLIHFYSSYDAKPLKAEVEDDDFEHSNGYEADDYDENY